MNSEFVGCELGPKVWIKVVDAVGMVFTQWVYHVGSHPQINYNWILATYLWDM
jgi:hypothetical protein